MEYFALFNLLILFLFFLSKRLTQEIFSFFYTASGSEKISTNILAFIFFPGVLIHELSHFFAAKILLVSTGKMILLPKREDESIKLGSVAIQRTNIFNEFAISIAPVAVGIILILGIIYLLIANSSGFSILKTLVSIYSIFVISNTMYASKKDLGFALPFLTVAIMLGIVLFIIGLRIPVITVEWLPKIEATRIFYTASLYLIIPIFIDLIGILLFRIMSRIW